MITPDRIAVLLLGGGLSRRFGADDKLLSLFDGAPLASHARESIGAIDFAARIVVVRDGAPELAALFDDPRFKTVINPAPEEGMAGSIRLGIAATQDMAIDAVMICLADMPNIDQAVIATLMDAFDPETGLIVCCADAMRSPPALIGRRFFAALAALTGDGGARDLLREAPTLAVPMERLLDVDRPVAH